MKWNPSKIFLTSVIVLFVVGVIGILIYLSTGELTTRETGLLSTILTILSVIAAWVVSHYYSTSSHRQAIEEVKTTHQENLQTYALKAAEKVTNLSNQLNKLSIYLEEEIENTEYETVEESLRSREERLHSAIHMIGMLKSINDTSLSDWQGVIGEQLEEQREEREEKEEELRELVIRLETLWDSQSIDSSTDYRLQQQLDALQRDIRLLMAGVVGVSVKLHKPRKKVRRNVEKKCPICGNDLSFQQRARANSHKAIECPSCNNKLVSRYSKDDDDFIVEKREEVNETINCPDCNEEITFALDNYPSTSKSMKCDNCASSIRATRLPNGEIKLSSHPAPSIQLTDEIIDEVNKLLPKQPWPKDIHKQIADKLCYSNSLISKATKELIRRGLYKEQIDGKLYELVEVETSD